MSDSLSGVEALPPERARQIDDVCNRFEAAWKAGAPPCLEDFLDAWMEPERSVLLRELVLIDVDYRRQRGETSDEPYRGLAGFDPRWLQDPPAVTTSPHARGLAAPTDSIDVASPTAGSSTGLPILDDYDVLEEIARGGMGVVYRAHQKSLNRVVALKMILAGPLASPEAVRRFRIEAENAAGLEHPHIVPIYEVGESHNQPYFAMKLVDGGSLTLHLDAFVADPGAAARLIGTVARAVHHAHQRGILHRDLKPANILLDAQGQPHVTDFGLAKRMEGSAADTSSGAMAGTPAYMAPEQVEGKSRLTTAVDVYGLGAVLYELLTGQPPFKARTPLETLLQVTRDEPVPPSRHRPRLPRDLEVICLKCLRKEPSRRYASAEELAEDLARFDRGEPIAARAVNQWERGVKWVRRNPVMSAMAAALVLVLVAGVIVSSYFAVTAWQKAKEAEIQTGIARSEKEEAKRQAGIAKDKAEEAGREREEAKRQAGIAKDKAEEAGREKEEAKRQTGIAKDKADEAARQTGIAQQALERAQDQLERTQLALYAGQLAQAQLEWRDGNVTKAKEILNNCKTDLRATSSFRPWGISTTVTAR